jgi:hypothetical protein
MFAMICPALVAAAACAGGAAAIPRTAIAAAIMIALIRCATDRTRRGRSFAWLVVDRDHRQELRETPMAMPPFQFFEFD